MIFNMYGQTRLTQKFFGVFLFKEAGMIHAVSVFADVTCQNWNSGLKTKHMNFALRNFSIWTKRPAMVAVNEALLFLYAGG